MLMPAPMKRVNLFILARDEHKVIRALGRLRLIHLEPADAGGHAPLREKPDRDALLEQHRRLVARIDALLAALGCDADGPAAQVPHLSTDDIAQRLRDVEAASDEIRRQMDRLETDRKQLDAMIRDLQAFVGLGIAMERVNDFSFLHFAVGSLPAASLDDLSERVGDNVVLMPRPGEGDEPAHLVAVTSKKGRFALETELERAGFHPERPEGDRTGLADDLVRQARDRRATVEVQRDLAERLRREKAGELGPVLRAYRRTVVNELSIIDAEANFAYTEAACYITGWVPADQVDDMTECVLEVTAGCAAVEIQDPTPDSEPPSKLQQNPWLRPFSMLVAGYGFPRYREIEPTLFVAITFVLMFAFMFGDAGHGAVLALVGLGMKLKARKETVRDAGVILIACGLAAAVMGALENSYFGYHPFKGLMHDPLENALSLMIVSIIGGAVMISVGLVANIVNRLRAGDVAHGIFDKFGLVGTLMYWAMLWLAFKALASGGKDLPLAPVLVTLVLGVAMLFVREPLLVFLKRRRNEPAESLPEALIAAAAEIMEVFISYLANSLSFIRLAAYAVSHAALLLATLKVIEMVRDIESIGRPLGWLVFLVGNALIILMEGLIAAIQALRLEYYEFFGKFFSGSGRAYRPFETE